MKKYTNVLSAFLLALMIPLSFNQVKATPLSATITSSTNVLCNGGSNGNATVTATGGTSPYQYLWSTNPTQATATATGLTAGTYTVVVADASFATATATVIITEPTPLMVSTSLLSPISCSGGSGCLQASASGGVYPYSYAWSPGGLTTASACGLIAGIYSVVVTDVNGCSSSAADALTQPTQIIVHAIVMNNILCNGGNNGRLSGIVTGGISPYTYLWTPLHTSSDSVSGVSAGCYTLTVTDNNGCTASGSICLTQPPAIVITHSSTNDTGGCSGSATVSVTGGNSPYTYFWSNGGTSYTISNLCHGAYCCAVTDHSGCMDSVCLTIDSCINTFNEPICIITLDTATNNCELIWGRTNSPPSGGYGHYNVYKDTNNTDVLIHSQALNVLSEYTDPTSNPSLGAVSYKISTFDSCGESALSPVHTSIYLTTTASLNVYILNWTAYVGFTPTKYIIYRGPSLSTLLPIDSVANNVFTYHDTLPPLGSYYVLEAESPHGPCIPSAHKPNNFSLLSGSFSNGFNTGTLLGINNIGNNLSGLKVYPNPSSGMFTLSYSMSNSDNVGISIINELGQEVYTEQKHGNTGQNTEQLNIENLASGIYTLRMQTSTGTSVRKLLIMPGK